MSTAASHSNLNGYLAQKKQLWLDEARHAEPKQMLAKCSVKSRSGVREIRIRDHQIIADSGRGMAGYDLGASAQEIMLGGLAACVAHVYLIAAATLEVPLTTLDVSASASCDTRPIDPESKEPPSRMENIAYDVHVSSVADQAKIEELHEYVEKFCPVRNTLANPCSVEATLHYTKADE